MKRIVAFRYFAAGLLVFLTMLSLNMPPGEDAAGAPRDAWLEHFEESVDRRFLETTTMIYNGAAGAGICPGTTIMAAWPYWWDGADIATAVIVNNGIMQLNRDRQSSSFEFYWRSAVEGLDHDSWIADVVIDTNDLDAEEASFEFNVRTAATNYLTTCAITRLDADTLDVEITRGFYGNTIHREYDYTMRYVEVMLFVYATHDNGYYRARGKWYVIESDDATGGGETHAIAEGGTDLFSAAAGATWIRDMRLRLKDTAGTTQPFEAARWLTNWAAVDANTLLYAMPTCEYILTSIGWASYVQPASSLYWTYPSFELADLDTAEFEVGNWTVAWDRYAVGNKQNNFYYDDAAIDPTQWGDWGIWNFLRNGLAGILNVLFVILSGIFFLIVVGFQVVIVLPLVVILVIFNNYIIMYLLLGLIWIIWLLWELILWVFELLMDFLTWLWEDVLWPICLWVYNTLLLPAWEWCVAAWQANFPDGIWAWFVDVAVPWLVDVLIYLFTFIATIFIVIVTLGNADFQETWNFLIHINQTFAVGAADLFGTFVANFTQFVLYAATYLALVGMLFVKIIYCKARGYHNRVAMLEQSLDAYLMPIRAIVAAIQKIKDVLTKNA